MHRRRRRKKKTFWLASMVNVMCRPALKGLHESGVCRWVALTAGVKSSGSTVAAEYLVQIKPVSLQHQVPNSLQILGIAYLIWVNSLDLAIMTRGKSDMSGMTEMTACQHIRIHSFIHSFISSSMITSRICVTYKNPSI